MALAPFTTNDQVRSTLGVTAEELSDTTLDYEIYGENLRLELDLIQDNNGSLIEAFEDILDVAESSRTASQAQLYRAVVLFAPYPVALHLETAAPLFTPKMITDGKASVTRHSESPFKDVFDRCRQNYERYRQHLLKAWATYNSSSETTATLPQLLRVVTPATDPVTGA